MIVEGQKADEAALQAKLQEEAAAEKERQRVAMLAVEEEKKRIAAEEAARKAAAAKPGPAFRDCIDVCPEMIPLPAGEFIMGNKANTRYSSAPRHKVTFAKPFALAKHEVTFAEWDACASEGGCQKYPKDEGWGRGRRPVINVTWYDAQQYASWLSKKTGKTYRLPSEAEWEYAARAGTTTRFAFGDKIIHGQAHFSNARDNNTQVGDAQQTVEVGSFPPNAWGLHDMHGNVYEWCADTWHEDYKGAPKDGSAWLGGDVSKRVQRGGSWNDWVDGFLESDYREKDEMGDSGFSVGFRIARIL